MPQLIGWGWTRCDACEGTGHRVVQMVHDGCRWRELKRICETCWGFGAVQGVPCDA